VTLTPHFGTPHFGIAMTKSPPTICRMKPLANLAQNNAAGCFIAAILVGMSIMGRAQAIEADEMRARSA
jgi:hypothetical protein